MELKLCSLENVNRLNGVEQGRQLEAPTVRAVENNGCPEK